MQFTVHQRFFFDAAHTLERAIETESSRRIHGHTYYAEVSVTGPRNPDNGMVIDLGLMTQLAYDVASMTLTAGPGVRRREVNQFLLALERLLPAGSCGNVGLSGLALGGG